MRKALLAVLLAVFAAGAFLILRPAVEDGGGPPPAGDPVGREDGPPGSGPDRRGGTDPSRRPPPKGGVIRVGGATVDNSYPAENFSHKFINGACAVLGNETGSVAVEIVSIRAEPAAWFSWDTGCEEGLGEGTDSGFDERVPCAPDVVLTAKGQTPRRGCRLRVRLLQQGEHEGGLVLVTRARCASRTGPPCSLIGSRGTPTAEDPVTVLETHRLPLHGVTDDGGTPPEEVSPGPGEGPSPGEVSPGPDENPPPVDPEP